MVNAYMDILLGNELKKEYIVQECIYKSNEKPFLLLSSLHFGDKLAVTPCFGNLLLVTGNPAGWR